MRAVTATARGDSDRQRDRERTECGALLAWEIPPLFKASEDGDEKEVGRLLMGGVKPNSPDELNHMGWSPLHVAAQKGHAAVCELLLKAGADIEYQHPETGFTALMVAAQLGQAAACELLLKKGADTEYQTPEFGATALHLAVQSLLNPDDEPGKLQTLQVLLRHQASVNAVDSAG